MQASIYQRVVAPAGLGVGLGRTRKEKSTPTPVVQAISNSASFEGRLGGVSEETTSVHLPTALDARAGRLQAELRAAAAASCSRRNGSAVYATTCSGAGVSDANEEGTGKSDGFNENIRVPTSMALGSFQGVTLEKGSLDLSAQEETFEASLDEGGGGGNNGGKLNNGGGGDGDDGDDDDYFDDWDEGDDGDDGAFTRRSTLPELFDRATIDCVLQEWFKTLEALPGGLRMAVEMGIVSSAQLWRFLAADSRPTIVRAVSRITPASFSRGFTGRLMGDPAFIAKLGIDQTLTCLGSLYYEFRHRQDKFFKEFDLVMANTLTLMLANATVVWMITPSRSFGAVHKYPWQRMLHDLPNHVFDKTGPLRNYTNTTRGVGALVKAAELSTVGLGIGALGAGLNRGLINLRKMRDPGFEPTPCQQTDVGKNALGMGAWMGLSCAFRYQALSGLDRLAFDTYSNLKTVVSGGVFMRGMNYLAGEPNRKMWCGLPREFPEMQMEAPQMPQFPEELAFQRRLMMEKQVEDVAGRNNAVPFSRAAAESDSDSDLLDSDGEYLSGLSDLSDLSDDEDFKPKKPKSRTRVFR